MRKIKNIIILAGGDSTRFWPIEDKNILSFLSKPLILHQLEELARYGDKITIVAGQTNVVTFKRLIENSGLDINYQVLVQKEVSGQAGAVLSAKNIVKGEVLIVNANDVFDYSFLDRLNLEENKSQVIFFGKNISEYFPGGYFKFDSQNRITEVIEKPDKDKLPSSITKLVLDYYPDFNLLIDAIEKVKTDRDDRYEKAISMILKSDVSRKLIVYEGIWQSLKFAWHILLMMKIFLFKIKKNNVSSKAEISKKANLIGPVIIEDGVKIGDFVKIVGPAYIGENTIIGDYSLVRESQIGKDCLIGSYSEVARSYIGNKVFLHRNYVGDSILADESMMGAQAVTANYRFDELTVSNSNLQKLGAIIGRQSKIGVNSTLIPGVKIGKKSWVGPGETVREDIKDKTYFVKNESKINLKV